MKIFPSIARLRLTIFLAAMFVLPLPLPAAEVTTLYEVAIPVVGQGAEERNRAIRQAFSEVLIRASGDRDVPGQPALQEAFADTLSYVQQYRYHKLSRDGLEPADEAHPSLELRVVFDARAVNQLLFNTGNPVWGRARPTTVVWLAVQEQTRRFLVGGDTGRAFQEEITRQARRRGIPVLFPLMDLEDQAALHFMDVWGNFRDSIMTASRRYQSEAILAGRLYRRQDGEWEGRWTLYSDAEPRFWSSSAESLATVLAAGIDGSADSLARRFAQRAGGVAGQMVLLSVSAVHELKDYARVLGYLESIDAVERLQVARVEGDKVLFRLNLRGDGKGLRQAIAFGGALAPEIGMDGAAPGMDRQREAILTYRLLQ